MLDQELTGAKSSDGLPGEEGPRGFTVLVP